MKTYQVMRTVGLKWEGGNYRILVTETSTEHGTVESLVRARFTTFATANREANRLSELEAGE